MPPQKSKAAFESCKSTIFWAMLEVSGVVIVLEGEKILVKGPKANDMQVLTSAKRTNTIPVAIIMSQSLSCFVLSVVV